MKRAPGFSLIEVMVAVSVGTVMVAIAVGLIHSLLRLEHSVRDDFRWRMDCNRLAAQFREDCHAARRQPISGKSPPPELVVPRSATADVPGAVAQNSCQFFVTPDHAIEYRVETERLVREERSGGKVLQRESYLLPPGVRVSWEFQGEGDSAPGRPGNLPGASADRPVRLAVLRIIPRADVPRDPKSQPLRIEAAVGTDHRFQQAKGT